MSQQTWLGPLEEAHSRMRAYIEPRPPIIDMEKGMIEQRATEEELKQTAIENIKRILEIHESLRPAFLRWWNDDVIDESMAVANYSIRRIKELTGCSDLMVFVWLDRLIRDAKNTYVQIIATESCYKSRCRFLRLYFDYLH